MPNEIDANPIGRPSEYKTEYCKMAEVFCKKGATDKELGELFGVSDTTINNWKNQHPEFLASLKNGKEVADNQVEKSLFERANGYSHKETKFAIDGGKFTDDVEVDKNYPPDTTACIFWLKNRRPKEWRDRHEHKHEGSLEIKTIEQLVKDKEGK